MRQRAPSRDTLRHTSPSPHQQDCPNCGGATPVLPGVRSIHCSFCGTRLDVDEYQADPWRWLRRLAVPTIVLTVAALALLAAVAVATTARPALPSSVVSVANSLSSSSYAVCASGCRFAQIQEAVEAAGAGDVITIGPGTYHESLVIGKSIILRGTSAAETQLHVKAPLIIRNPTEINVEVHDLTVDGSGGTGRASGCLDGIEACLNGIIVRGRAHVLFHQIVVTASRDRALWVRDNAQVTIKNSQITGNYGGLQVTDSTVLTMEHSTIDGTGGTMAGNTGLHASGRARISLNDVVVANNTYSGIMVREEAQAEISNSTIKDSTSGHNGAGLLLYDRAAVTVRGSKIESNGINEWCLARQHETQICNGISLGGASKLTLSDTIVRGNPDWGISARHRQCGYRDDLFIGQVTFQGTNTIEGNNASGSATGLRNPGRHQWNRPEVPDGQVCVP